MGSPVEMEFAVDLNSDPAWFGFLQIRRLVVGSEPDQVRLNRNLIERSVLFSEKALGNGVVDGIKDVGMCAIPTNSTAPTPRSLRARSRS